MFQFLASHLNVLFSLLSILAMGAFTFTNEWFTADEESWTMTTVSTDTIGVLTFNNANYKVFPKVFLVPQDSSFVTHQMAVQTIGSALLVTITQITLAGAGACRVIVQRRH